MIRISKGIRFATMALLMAALTFAVQAQAAEIDWHTDFEKASKQAAKESKPIVAMFTATWCGPCKRMKASTFHDDQVVKLINENFVPVLVDVDRDKATSRRFKISAMPTTLVIDPKTGEADRVRGYQGASQFASFLNSNRPDIALVAGSKQTKPGAGLDMADYESNQGDPLLSKNCLVTVVSEGKLVAANPKFTAEHEGLKLQFASAAKRDEFVSNPAKFFPELRGYCPVTLKEKGELVRGEARWVIEYNDQLFMCTSKDNALRFLDKPEAFAISKDDLALKESETRKN